MEKAIIEEGGFRYVETSPGSEVLLLLHGLFGSLSNFRNIVESFKNYNVVIPILPIMELPIKSLGLKSLVEHIESFIDFKAFHKVHLLGNSLGGHLAQLYALKIPSKVATLTLTASSGLFESSFGSTFPKRGNYEFIKTKVESTFYSPKTATKEMIDGVFETVNNRSKAIRVVVTAKSAVRNNLEDKISAILTPTLLIWGKNDTITPPFVGEKFQELIPNSELVFLEECGHAPMMEQPTLFNKSLLKFLEKNSIPIPVKES